MYKKGEYVIYGSSGVCMVGEITTLNLENIPKDKEYYVLFPKNNGAEDALYLELGTALNLQKDQVLEYVIKEIEKNNKEQ